MLRIVTGRYHPDLEQALVEEVRSLKSADPLASLAIVVPSDPLKRRIKQVLCIERGLALDRPSQRPEMRGQKQRQRHAGYAVHGEGPEPGMAARRPARRGWGCIHANSPETARQPKTASTRASAAMTASNDLPRQPRVSRAMVRKPIGAWIATARTNVA